MKNIINKLLVNHSLIYKLFLYIATIILVVYLFPKSGQFKYEFQKGKPWEYENYYAPFDFAIQKTPEEIALEKEQITKLSKQFFKYDEQIVVQTKNVINSKIEDALSNAELNETKKSELRDLALQITNSIYEFGYLEATTDIKPDIDLITLKKGNKSQEIDVNKLFKASQILSFINSKIGNQPFTQEENIVLNIIYEGLKPNVTFDTDFTEMVLQENLGKISYTKGLVAENERIIFKGDIVEGEKLITLNSVKSEFESQVWSKSNYNWIVSGYTILVALAFLMLLLFLRKYREEIFENNTKVTFIFFNIILIVLLITLIVKYDAKYIYIAPIVILPLVLKAFFDARLGLFTHVLTVLLLLYVSN